MSDHAPLPANWNDRAFAEACRRLRECPRELTDADVGMFLVAEVRSRPRLRRRPGPLGAACGRGGAVREDAEGARQRRPGGRGVRGGGQRVSHVARLEAVVEHRGPPGGAGGSARGPGRQVCGVARPGRRYAVGSLTTRQGGLWLATADTDEVPGEGRTAWTMIVKRGTA